MVYCAIRNVGFVLGVVFAHRKMIRYSSENWLLKCQKIPDWQKIHHLIVVPSFKEDKSTLDKSFMHLASSNFPKENLSIVFATEDNDDLASVLAEKYKKEFGDCFANFFITRHKILPGEVAGKGSNQTYAVKQVWQELRQQCPDKKNLLVTSLDADYRVHPEYFSLLTYQYLTVPNAQYKIFQPIPMFFNNIWEAPFFSRLIATFIFQWLMVQFAIPDDLTNYSCYSLSYELLAKADFWDPAIIQEDSRLYWRTFFAVGEKLEVQPLYVPVYGNVICDKTFLGTLKSQYKQIKRWAWGATDLPFVFSQSLKHSEISIFLRIKSIVWLFFSHMNWVVLPIITFLGAGFVFLLNPDFSHTVLFYNLGYFLAKLFIILLVLAVIFVIITEVFIFPPKPSHWSSFKRAVVVLQWFTFPVVGLFLALISLDSQTRILLGKKIIYETSAKNHK